MASIDLKDANYSVQVHPDHQKYLKFCWKGRLLQYTCFPDGLAFCPRKFTKLMKPIFATLCDHGHLSVGFMDDSYLQGDDYEQCITNITDTVALVDKVSLVPHPDKSAGAKLPGGVGHPLTVRLAGQGIFLQREMHAPWSLAKPFSIHVIKN
jgi:hypothetical protein